MAGPCRYSSTPKFPNGNTVNTARRNLFSAYNNYRWAVDYGILN